MNSPLQLDQFRFAKTTLSNGLEVIARRQGPLPVIAVNLWYHVGSKNEERRQRGFAHLFEHLMFEGSEHYPGDFFKPLQRLGASINGSTSSDRTNYYEDVPAAHVELALAMESDRMGFFLPALTEEKLRIQKDVVKNEYRQNVANRPYGMAWRLLAEAMFPPSHPYSWTTIGLMEDVEAASRDDVEAFFRRFYVPSNASLAIVGDIDEERALALADRYFGDLPGGIKAPPVWTPETGLPEGRDLTFRDRVELDRIYLAWHTVPHFGPDDAALVVLGDILGRGKSGRLFRRLVVERGLVQDVGAHQSGRELAGTFGITATLRPGKSWEEVRGLIDAEIASIADRGVEEAELTRVKNGRQAGFIYALDNVGGFGGVADRLNAYNTYLGDPGRITSDFQRYQSVDGESVRRAAATYLDRASRVCLSVLGRKPTTVVTPLDRRVPPSPSSALAYRAPRPEVRSLRCGVPIWFLPRRDLPIVAASFVIDAGASTHAASQGGLASLTADLLDEGTTTRSSHEIALSIEGMGTSLSASAGWDGSYVGLQCLSSHLEPTLDLAVDILRNPSFPESEWNRIHAQTLAGLKAERDSAEARAGRALLRALFDVEHPYRIPSDGDESTVSRLTIDDLRGFHRGRYMAGHAACVVAGDVDPDEVVALLDARLSDWTGEPLPSPAIPQSGDAGRSRILLLDRPGAPQAVVRVGQTGTNRLDPDFMDLTVWNQILGGQFTSRLNARLREEKGFTYGVRSHFDFRRGAGPFVISSSLQSDRLAEALDDLRGEVVALLGDRPPSMAELDDARRSLIEGQARHFETPSALVSRYAGLFLHGLPDDYHARFAERLEAVRPSTMEAAARRKIDPTSLVFVVVADAEIVAGPLEKLGWAVVERFDERDEPIRP
ncbi:M16 family metallopeptidase [Tundrisphaera lichenicola]|uniref:M16 family metallopeptidase n=1 Tax=Tundrisphaera lichenicola TaxID=2029860 RepID=UPI003EB98DCC